MKLLAAALVVLSAIWAVNFAITNTVSVVMLVCWLAVFGLLVKEVVTKRK